MIKIDFTRTELINIMIALNAVYKAVCKHPTSTGSEKWKQIRDRVLNYIGDFDSTILNLNESEEDK